MAGNDEYTSLLIHSDTSNGSTTFEDDAAGGAGTPHTITKTGTGTLEHSTTKYKFGATSIKFYTTYAELGFTTDNHADFAPDGDFTVDFWILFPAGQPYQFNVRMMDGSSNGFVCSITYDYDSTSVILNLIMYSGGAMTYYAYVGQVNSVAINTWHHVLFQRNGSNLQYAWNGDFITPMIHESPGANQNPASSAPCVFHIPEDNAGTIYVDEIRVSSGIARETSGDFTPPTEPYEEDAQPVSLSIDGGTIRVFGRSPAVLWSVQIARLRLVGGHPVCLPIQTTAGQIRVVGFDQVVSNQEILQIPAGLIRTFGQLPGIKELFAIPQARAVSVGGQAPSTTIGILITAAGLVLVVSRPVTAVGKCSLYPTLALIAASQPPHYRWAIQEPETGQTIYRFYLDDLVIPVSSIQMRRRDGDPTYIAVVVPSSDYDTDEAAINARAGGVMVVKRGFRFQDGREQLEEIGRATIESMGGSKTAISGEINLTGHKTITNSAPKTVELEGASYRNITDGKRRYRCVPDNFLEPGDTVIINGESFIVGAITYTIEADSERMEISEAE